MDDSDYNRILHYKKLSAKSSKLLGRKERHFRTKLRLFTIRDEKLFRNGKQVLHSRDAYSKLVKTHGGHPNCLQVQHLARVEYHDKKLRLVGQPVVTQCKECQQRIDIGKSGPVFHLTGNEQHDYISNCECLRMEMNHFLRCSRSK